MDNRASPSDTAVQAVANRCNLAPWVIASPEFNDAPQPLRIVGVREEHRAFFAQLQDVEDPAGRGQLLHQYLERRFHLQEWANPARATKRTHRHSYLRFIRGWGVDSNSMEGAVLKSWVESRFGLRPRFHREKLLGQSQDDDHLFLMDRMKGLSRTNAIFSQLDLVYEYCQQELLRRLPGEQWLKLFRGTFDAEGYDILHKEGNRTECVRLNNLSSFTNEKECAWQFGSRVWEVQIPLVKVFFFSSLLPCSILKGEGEFLVIGGTYHVKEHLY